MPFIVSSTKFSVSMLSNARVLGLRKTLPPISRGLRRLYCTFLFLYLPTRYENIHITLLTKVHRVKAMVFPVVIYRCESWTIKVEYKRTDAFKVWCWRILLSVPWTAEIQPVNRKGNQSWIFIGRTDAEVPTLWLSDAKSWFIGKDPDARLRLRAGGERGDRE